MLCPKCSHQRTSNDDPSIPEFQCPSCGIIYSKFNQISSKAAKQKSAMLAKPAKASSPEKPKRTPEEAKFIAESKQKLIKVVLFVIGPIIALVAIIKINSDSNTTSFIANLWTWAIVIVPSLIILWISDSKRIDKRRRKIEETLSQIADFTAAQHLISVEYNTVLAIDEQRNKVCIIDWRKHDLVVHIFTYKDLLSSEIFEDGQSVTKTSRSSQIGGVLIGALALGGLGAIIGGLSGKTKTSNTIKQIDLRLTVNDIHNPVYDINLFDGETEKDSAFYRRAIKQARHWHGLIDVLIKRADMEDKINNGNGDSKSPQLISVADELKKLLELHESGALSLLEFNRLKTQLLGK